MHSHLKVRALRALGGVVAALAVVPWLGVGAASAAGGGDNSCATRPAGVSGDAACVLLLGPNGTKVMGETWAVRTSDNHILVWTFPDMPLQGAGSVALCVQTSGAYPPKHQCTPFDTDNVYTGDQSTIDVALGAHGIAAGADVFYSLSVLQGSSAAVSNGQVGAVTTGSPSPSPTTTSTSPSPSPTPSHTHSHSPSPSPTISDTTTATHSKTPSASVLPTKIGSTPSTSVLATKLAHTGAPGVSGALVISILLLGLGGILLTAAQVMPAGHRRRH